jgi:hypothetical protein
VNPKDAAGWIETDKFLKDCPKPPAWLARLVAKKLPEALRKAIPYKAPIRLPRGVKAKVKRASLPKLKKELDRVFSLFIRQRDATAGSDGYGYCATCGYLAHWKEMDCGHYVPRQDLATRWDERNCHLQCKSCNGFRGGEPEKMAEHIDLALGRGTAAELRELGKKPFKLNRQWLESKIAEYKAKVTE